MKSYNNFVLMFLRILVDLRKIWIYSFIVRNKGWIKYENINKYNIMQAIYNCLEKKTLVIVMFYMNVSQDVLFVLAINYYKIKKKFTSTNIITKL